MSQELQNILQQEMSPSTSNGIKISEIFYSLQGEGLYCGVPSIFVRVFGCNFTCKNFGRDKNSTSIEERFNIDPSKYKTYKELPLVKSGCDSYPAWDVRFKHLSPVVQIKGIVDRIQELLPTEEFGDKVHLIMTGGEPLLGWQRQYGALLDEIHNRGMNLKNLTFETNGTQLISSELRWSLNNHFNHHNLKITFSVSPKLTVSGEKWTDAIKPDVVRTYSTIAGSQTYFKFVVATDEDVKDALLADSQFRVAGVNHTVYLMAEGGTEENYNLNRKRVAELALSYGFRYSQRLHVDLWKNDWNR